MWVGGWAVGLNDNNAILNSVDVEVEVGVELGNVKTCFLLKKIAITKRIRSGRTLWAPPMQSHITINQLFICTKLSELVYYLAQKSTET